MKYFSLFSGIGGFELGIQQAYEDNNRGFLQNKTPSKNVSQNSTDIKVRQDRIACVGYSEIDKYAIQIYERHFPKHKNYGDITKIIASELPDHDLLVGGFPCQSFSIAGKRGGFEDTRGTLFFEIARILKTKRPRLLLLENVKGLLSHDEGNTFATIISTLDELGYDCQWQVLNSKNFGVPQNRERVFIVGHFRGTSRPKVFPLGETTSGIIKISRKGKHQQDIVYRTDGIMTSLPAGTHGSSKHLTKIEQLNQPKHSNNRVYSEKGLSPTLNTAQGGNRQPFVTGGLQAHASTMENCSTALTEAMGKGGGHTPIVNAIRRLTPTECERLQGFPDGWTEGVSDTQRYKTLGNAVTVNVIREIIKRLREL